MDISQKVLEAFQIEHQEQLHRIRSLLDELNADPSPDREHCLDEAFRMAHSLKGGARVCDLGPAVRLGHGLETVFSRVREDKLVLDSEAARVINVVLDSIEDWMAALLQTDAPPEPTEAMQAIERLLDERSGDSAGSPTASPSIGQQAASVAPGDGAPDGEQRSGSEPPRSATTVDPQFETIRIRADSLDRLLKSSGQLLTESMRQDQVSRELGEMRRIIELMERQRKMIRRVKGAGLHRVGDQPELRPLARFLETVERQIHVLSQRARQLCLKQQQSCWLLRASATKIQQDIRRARMVSAESLFQGFPKMVRDLARDEGKRIEFKIIGADVRADRIVLQALKDPIMHMLRNSVIHGIELPEVRTRQGKSETGSMSLVIQTMGNQLQVTIEDDGRGIDLGRIAEVASRRRRDSDPSVAEYSAEELSRLIFKPGFSTCTTVTELAGRGMGLSVVHETVKRLQGGVQLVHREDPGSAILLSVPLSVCTHRLLLVATGDQTFAVPLHAIERLVRTKANQIETLEGVPVVIYGKQPVPIVSLASLVGIADSEMARGGDVLSTIILKSGSRRLAIAVDGFLGERDALVQDLDSPAARKEYAGAILLEDGRPLLVLNPAQLLEREKHAVQPFAGGVALPKADRRPSCVLVVDDSFTTRTMEKSILEAHGYQVQVAMDGVEAISKLQGGEINLVISDVEMPRLDGFGLLEEMKKQPKLCKIPVILVTSRDRPEDQQRGLELGAEAYIVKRKFDHQDLLSTIRQVL